MDRTKIKDQFGQFGRRREYGADDDGGLQDGCESAE